MDPLFDKNFITTKQASEISGYTPDYLARLARSGKISGKRIGHSWLVERESLDRFVAHQDDHKIDNARALTRSREAGYRAHRSAIRRATNALMEAPTVVSREPVIDSGSLRSRVLALSVAFIVVATGALGARATALSRLALSVADIANEAAVGFKANLENVSALAAARVVQSGTNRRTLSHRIVTNIATVSGNLVPSYFVEADLSLPRIALSADDLSRSRIAPASVPFSVSAQDVLSVVRGAIALAQTSTRLVSGLAASPSSAAAALSRAHRALGEGAYATILASLSAYRSLVEGAGEAAFSHAVASRDALAVAPRLVSRTNLALGEAVIALAHSAIRADVAFAYWAADSAPATARASTVLALRAGGTLAGAAARAPALAAALYLRATATPAELAPRLARAAFGAEYEAAERLLAFSRRATESYLALVDGAGRLAYAGTERAGTLVMDVPRHITRAPRVLENAVLGALGRAALALRSLGEAGLALDSLDAASSLAAARPALSGGERAALALRSLGGAGLATYETISGFMRSARGALASLFGSSSLTTGAPPPPIVMPSVPPRTRVTVATSTPRAANAAPRAINNSYPTYTTVVQGVSQDAVDRSLASLRADVLATAAGMVRPVAAQGATNATTIQHVNMIQDLSNLIVRNGDFRGGVFDNGERVSATTGTFTTLTGGSTTLGSLTVSGAASLATTTITGALTVSGTTTPGIIAATNYISAPYFVATSTTATSTFAGSLAIDTDGFVYATTTRNVGIGILSPAALLAIRNSTSTQPLFVASSAAGAEVYRITNAGFVGIGTTSPYRTLSVAGSGVFTGGDVLASTFTATSSITAASLSLTTALPVSSGGTGWGAVQASAIPYGNGAGALATTTAGTAGYVLAYTNGIPAWVATTTFSSGLSYSAGNVTNTGVLSLAQTYGSAQTGALTLATSSDTNLLLNVTNSGGTFTFAPAWTGTLAAARLNGNVVQAITNDTNVTGSISSQNLTLGWTGQLGVSRGGTGASSLTSSQLLYGAGMGAIQSVATTSLSLGTGLLYSGTLGALVGGAGGTLTVATSSLYSGTTGQLPYFSGTNTLTATSSIFLATSGYVGVGTASPSYPLHVAGQCVTADTRLRRRRRKKGGERADAEKGEWEDGEYVYDLPMIKDVRANDEIASMDMHFGTLEWRRVNGIVYTGIQNLIRITTQSGRSIRTTAVHPYFVHAPRKNEHKTSQQKLYRFYADQSIRFDEYARDTHIAIANEEQSFVISIPKLVKQALRDAVPDAEYRKVLASAMFGNALAMLSRVSGLRMHELVVDTEYTGTTHESVITAILKGVDPELLVSFGQVGKKSPAHKAAYGAFVGKRASDMTAGTDTLFAQMEHILGGASSGTSFAVPVAALRPARSLHGDGGIALAVLRKLLWESGVVDGIKTENALRTALYGYIHPAHHNPQASSGNDRIGRAARFVKDGAWVYAQNVKIGQKIAVTYGDVIEWDKIINIEYLPAESVYDIEIEGTHNFIGNDIVAHNTYLGGDVIAAGNVGIGTTTPAYLLTIAPPANARAEIRMTSTNGNGSRIIMGDNGAYEGGIGWNQNISNAIEFFTNSDLSNAKMILTSTGNVGIGTTSPVSKLSVLGESAFAGGASVGIGYAGTAAPTGGMIIQGNVGIGTTSPWAKLSVTGASDLGNFGYAGYFTATSTTATSTFSGGFVAGQCVTRDTRLRRRRRRSDGSYEYDEPDIVDIKEGDEIQSLDEKTGQLVWSRVKRLAYMGKKQTYRITTGDGRAIRTTANHPYLTSRGWKRVSQLREGVEIAVASSNDFGNAFGNLNESLRRETAESVSYESLVNRYHLTDEYNSFHKQAGALLFEAFDKIITTLRRRFSLRSDGDQNNILAGEVECIGRNNESGSLLERAEVGERKGNNNDVPAFIYGHTPSQDCYSRIQTMTPQVSGKRSLQSKVQSVSANAQEVTADFQVLISLLLARFGLRSSFAYAGSITLAVAGAQSEHGARSAYDVGKGIKWVKVSSIEAVAMEDVYDVEIEGTHNFIGNDIVAHNTAFTVNATAPASSLYIASSGNVGIGTTSPGYPLTIAPPLNARAEIGMTSTSGAGSRIVMGDNGAYEGGIGWNQNVGDAIEFFTNSNFTNPKIIITSAGNIGIGTTSPVSKLSVLGESAFAGGASVGIGYAGTAAPTGGMIIQGNVGIGETAPGSKLSVSGGATIGASYDTTVAPSNGMIIEGNVGIGTTSPYAKLSVVGQAVAEYFTATSTTATSTFSGGFVAGNNAALSVNRDASANSLYIATNGRVGIGTAGPIQALDVNGYVNIANGIARSGSSVVNAAIRGFNVLEAAGGQPLRLGANADQDNGIYIGTTGNVGIGTTSPWAKLSVTGASDLGNFGYAGYFTATSTTATSTFSGGFVAGNNAAFSVNQAASANSLYIAAGGNVGIGTAGPTSKLGLAGTGVANGITLGEGGTGVVQLFRNSDNYLKIDDDTDVSSLYIAGVQTVSRSGSDFKLGAGTSGSTNWGIFTGGTEKVRIDSAGNLGIGTTSPLSRLAVSGGASIGADYNIAAPTNGMIIQGNVGIGTAGPTTAFGFVKTLQISDGTSAELAVNSGTNDFSFGAVPTTSYIQSDSNIGIYTSGTARITITTSGNVGIGTTSPATTLSVQGNGYFSGTGFFGGAITGTSTLAIQSTTATSTFSTGGLTVGTSQFVVQQTSGNVGIGTTGPGGNLSVVGNSGTQIGTHINNTNTAGYSVLRIGSDTAHTAAGGALQFYGSTYTTSGANAALATTLVGFDTGGLNLVAQNSSGNIGFYTGAAAAGNQRMVINSSGNVGIGTTSPVSKLSVLGESAFAGGASVGIGYAGTAAPTGGMIIQGNVGIGTTSPAGLLSVSGSSGLMVTNTGSAYTAYFEDAANDASPVVIDTNGNIGIGTTGPSAKLHIAGADGAQGMEFLDTYFTSSSGSEYRFRHARGTAASPLVVANADSLGTLRFQGYDGSAWRTGASISASVDGVPGLSDMPGYLVFETTPDGDISPVERMRITSTGNLGIGTTSPWAKLSVTGSSDLGNFGYAGYFTATSTTATSTFSGGFVAGNNAAFSVNRDASANSLYIATSGNVGIGTASPTYPLDVRAATGEIYLKSTTATNRAEIWFNNGSGDSFVGIESSGGGSLISGSTGYATILGNGGANPVQLATNNAVRMTVTSAGNVGIGTTSPWAKLSVTGASDLGNFGYAGYFTATSTTATSTFSGGFVAGNNAALSVNRGATANSLYIAENGNVGIGTAGPVSKLDVRDGSLEISVTGLAHGNTDWVPTGVGARYGYPGTNGGAYTVGASNSGVGSVPYNLVGIFGSTDPTDSVPAIKLQGMKKSGGTGGIDLGSLETVLQLQNYTTPLVTVLGSGNLGIGTTSPWAKLSVTGASDLGNFGYAGYFTATSTTATSTFSGGFVAGNNAAFSVNRDASANSLYIATNGNVGIGTAGPVTKLEVSGGDIQASGFGHFKGWNVGGATGLGVDVGISGGQGWVAAYDRTTLTYYPLQLVASGGANAGIYLATSGNVGIGTTSPAGLLSVSGSSGLMVTNTGSAYTAYFEDVANDTSPVVIDTSGNVGIGTAGPGADVDLSKTKVGSPVRLLVNNADNTNAASDALLRLSTGGGSGGDTAIEYLITGATSWTVGVDNSDSDKYKISSSGGLGTNDRLTIDTSGNVGIGTTGPGYPLTVSDSTGTLLNVSRYNSNAALSLGSTPTAGPRITMESGRYGLRSVVMITSTLTNDDGATAPLVFATEGISSQKLLKGLQSGTTEVFNVTNSGGGYFAGNVGIGTVSPTSKLDVTTAGLGVTQTTSSGLALVNTTAATVGAQQISPALRWSGFGWKTDVTAASQAVDFRSFVVPVQGTANPTGYLSFGSSVNGGAYSDGQMVITTAGNVGIGTTSPLSRLAVSGGASIGADYNIAAPTNGMIIQGNVGIGTTSPDSIKLDVEDDIEIGTGTTGCVRDADNTTLVGTCVSDLALKKNIVGFSIETLDKLAQLRPVSFEWRNDEFPWLNGQTGINYGLIAQEVEAVFPEMIHTDDRGYKRVSYDIGLSMRMLEGIRELDARTRQILGSDGVLSIVPGVESQCVTGDTRLRRRRKNAKGGYEYDEVDIKDIVAGDEIQSLEEAAGRIVYARVNALIDMGEQEVYELVTRSGRRIRTTSNHPFLARERATKP